MPRGWCSGSKLRSGVGPDLQEPCGHEEVLLTASSNPGCGPVCEVPLGRKEMFWKHGRLLASSGTEMLEICVVIVGLTENCSFREGRGRRSQVILFSVFDWISWWYAWLVDELSGTWCSSL